MSSFLTSKAPFVLFEFLKKHTGIAWSEDLRLIGKVEDGELVGVIGYSDMTGSSCQMHLAGIRKGWISRRVLREMFCYPFITLDYKVAYATIASGNLESLDIARRMGFREIVFLTDAHPDGGSHLLKLTREDCKWLRRGNSDGKAFS